MNSILAFDLGGKCGWAHGVLGGKVTSGLIKTVPTRFESQGMRMIKFERSVRELLRRFNPQLVAFERIHSHSSTIAGQVWGAYSSSLMRLCDEAGVPYEAYGVGEIKKSATGKGNANKELMLAAAAARWADQKIESDDVADALHIMALGLKKMIGST